MPEIKVPYKPIFIFLLLSNAFFLSAVVFSRVILRGETVVVPDLAGKTPVEARRELARKDLGLSQGGPEFSEEWKRGLIIRQDPAPGSRIRVTKVVHVILSAGSETVAVPDLSEKNLEAAASLLREAGLTRGLTSQVHTARYAAGKVMGQKPPAGAVVERTTPVGLLVSQGEREERYIMPDLIGRRADRTIPRLRDLEFKIADIRYAYYPGLESGVIIKQYPPNGYKIQKRNLVALEVSR